MKNNNTKIIRTLSNRSLKANRMRNLFAIIAISLTALLFTSLFSIGIGMIQISEEQTMRQIGTWAHAGLKHVTKEQYDKITSQPSVKNSSFNILIAMATNDELNKRQTEIRYGEARELKFSFISLAEGRLPEKEDEIVVDTIVMDLLNIPHKIGSKVSLNYDFMGKSHEETFLVSGWYEGDPVIGASQVYLSKTYWDKLSSDYTEEEFVEAAKSETVGYGLINGYILFSNSFNIQGKLTKIIEDSGYSLKEIECGINWGYLSEKSRDIDPMSLIIIITAFLVMLLTGYLIIYNIFHISIMNDIRFYGLLKTIGVTKKQIRRLVNRQALLLSCVGIPLGLIMGYLISQCIMPILLKSAVGWNTRNFHLKANPYIFIFGAMFSLITVIISCRKPGKIAGSVSPVEAVKYEEDKSKNRKIKSTINGAKLSIMALANMGRSKKKTVVAILSMSLSIVILTEVYTFVNSFRLDQYLENMLTGDFTIGTISLFKYSGNNDLALPDEIYNAVNKQEGIESANRLYHTKYIMDHTLSENGHKKFQKLYKESKLDVDDYSTQKVQATLGNNSPVSEQRYAYDEGLITKLKVLDGSIDMEKFKTGNYVLVGTLMDQDCTYYKPGDKIELNFHGKESRRVEEKDKAGHIIGYHWIRDTKKSYEVMAVVDLPMSMTERSFPSNGLVTVMPVNELLSNDKTAECFSVSFQVEDDKEAAVQSFLENYTTQVDPYTNFESKEGLRDEFKTFTDTISIVGGSLSFIIAIIGILNFINTMLTSVITRRREFAMLQSIGLTNDQLKKLLIFEGIYYIAFTAVISFIIGSLLSVFVIRAVNNIAEFFVYQFTLVPFLAVIPLFVLVALVVPVFAYLNLKKYSIVERLREF